MIDGPSPIDPLLVEGPRVPMETLRPLVSFQRILLLNGGPPSMVDLATGDVRRWENGPAVQVPCVSSPFELSAYARIQTQVLRDPRPSPVDLVLCSLSVGDLVVDVVETTARQLEIRAGDPATVVASSPIGGSSAIVIVIEPVVSQGVSEVKVSARNAETVEAVDTTVSSPGPVATLTIGGPSTAITGRYGRRRLIPASVDVAVRAEPIDQFRRVARKARSVVENLRKQR